jgi:hypothetical protein
VSRGPGAVMRAVQSYLEASDKVCDPFEIAAAVYRIEPDAAGSHRVTDARLVSVRRALRVLVRQGEIRHLGRHWRFGRTGYASPSAAARYTGPTKW